MFFCREITVHDKKITNRVFSSLGVAVSISDLVKPVPKDFLELVAGEVATLEQSTAFRVVSLVKKWTIASVLLLADCGAEQLPLDSDGGSRSAADSRQLHAADLVKIADRY